MAEFYLGESPRFDVTAVELTKVYDALKFGTYPKFRWNSEDREKTVAMCAEMMELHGVDIDWDAIAERLDEDLAAERQTDRENDPDYDETANLPFAERSCDGEPRFTDVLRDR